MAHNLSGIIKSIRDIMREDRGINGDAQRIEQLGWMLFLKIFDDKDQELELTEDEYHSPIPAELQWRAWAADPEGITGDELLAFVDRTLFPALRELNPQRGSSVDSRALMVREVFEGNNNYMKSGVNLRKIINKLSDIDFNASEDRHTFGDLYEGILRELQSAGDSGEFYTPRAVTQFMTEMLAPRLGETVLDPACGTGGFLVCTVEHLKQQVRTPDERLRLQDAVRGMEYKPLPFVLALTNLILHDVEMPRIEYGDSLARQYDGIRERDRVNVILCNPPFGEKVVNNNEHNFPANFRTTEIGILFVALIVQLLKQGGRAAIAVPDVPLVSDAPAAKAVRKKLLEECNLQTIIRLPNIVPSANTQHSNLLFFEKGSPTKEIWYYEHRLPEGQKSYSKTKPIQVREFEPIRAWWQKRTESDVAWRVSIDTIKERGYDLDIKNPTKREDDAEHTSAYLVQMLHASLRKSASLLDELAREVRG